MALVTVLSTAEQIEQLQKADQELDRIARVLRAVDKLVASGAVGELALHAGEQDASVTNYMSLCEELASRATTVVNELNWVHQWILVPDADSPYTGITPVPSMNRFTAPTGATPFSVLQTDDVVTISGATDTDYNEDVTVDTVVAANVISFDSVSGTATTEDTGLTMTLKERDVT